MRDAASRLPHPTGATSDSGNSLGEGGRQKLKMTSPPEKKGGETKDRRIWKGDARQSRDVGGRGPTLTGDGSRQKARRGGDVFITRKNWAS